MQMQQTINKVINKVNYMFAFIIIKFEDRRKSMSYCNVIVSCTLRIMYSFSYYLKKEHTCYRGSTIFTRLLPEMVDFLHEKNLYSLVL